MDFEVHALASTDNLTSVRNARARELFDTLFVAQVTNGKAGIGLDGQYCWSIALQVENVTIFQNIAKDALVMVALRPRTNLATVAYFDGNQQVTVDVNCIKMVNDRIATYAVNAGLEAIYRFLDL
jgi:hypothetical protein